MHPALTPLKSFCILSQGFTDGVCLLRRPACTLLDLSASGIARGRSLFGWRCMPRARIQRNIARALSMAAARWGTAADIAPYVDPVPDWNIPLTQTEKPHHVQPPEKSQVRPEQKHTGHRRKRQRQDPVLRQALPDADAQFLCGHRSQRSSFCPRWGPCCAGAPPSWTRTESPCGTPAERSSMSRTASRSSTPSTSKRA